MSDARQSTNDKALQNHLLRRPQWIGYVGLIAGPPLALVLGLSLWMANVPSAAACTAAVGLWMAIWWTTEALPLAATAMLPILTLPTLGVMTTNQAAAPYADRLIFLFMGGLMLASAIEKWDLHRRIALHIVRLTGTQPHRLVGGFMLATAMLSMWISNTAATVMMLPIAASVIGLLERQAARGDANKPVDAGDMRRFATCLMIGVAYAASIGGLGTLIGTPTNAATARFLQAEGIEISFARWMLFGIPTACILLAVAYLMLTRVSFRFQLDNIEGGDAYINQEIRALGRMGRPQWTVLSVFLLTAFLWIFRQPLTHWGWLTRILPIVANLDDTIIALLGTLLLFAIPVSWRDGEFALDWQTAVRIPWGVLILFGGGLSLAAAVGHSGLAASIGQWLAQQQMSLLWLIIVVTAAMIFMTEVTSNTAMASLLIPLLIEAAKNFSVDQGGTTTVGIDPQWLVIPVGVAASCAFMFPVATPPNAIVFASGKVSIADMVRAGFLLNLIGIVLVPLLVYLLGSWALDFSPLPG